MHQGLPAFIRDYQHLKYECQAHFILVFGFSGKPPAFYSQNLRRNADTTSIPTTFVGMVIPTKLLGTVYFDKSCGRDGTGQDGTGQDGTGSWN